MDERELRRALDAYVARRLPPAPDLWPSIRARAVAYRHLRQAGELPQGEQMARGGAIVDGASRRPRVAAIGNVVATLALLLVVALVLTLVAGGMADRRDRDMGLSIATPTLVVPPGQPYPVPADCPVTPLRGPEERDGYVVYWLDSNGLTIGIERGLLFDGTTGVRTTGFQKIEARLYAGPSAPVNVYGTRDGMVFPAPGCWSLAGRGWQDRENRFFATVYVYPRQCRVRTIACLAPDGTVYLPDGTVHLTPTATVSPRPSFLP